MVETNGVGLMADFVGDGLSDLVFIKTLIHEAVI